MRVLVGCEFSGIVRDAFLARGHDAISCDLMPSEAPGPHYQGDIRDLCDDSTFDLFIAFPPCTYLSRSGAWRYSGSQEQRDALQFVAWLMGSPIPRIAIENPVGAISTQIRKPDQTIQPWQFGQGEVKRTCLWLENLPLLVPTNVVDGRVPRVYMTPARKSRQMDRSRTYQGIADAMADQWGSLATSLENSVGSDQERA